MEHDFTFRPSCRVFEFPLTSPFPYYVSAGGTPLWWVVRWCVVLVVGVGEQGAEFGVFPYGGTQKHAGMTTDDQPAHIHKLALFTY